mmetsp:Transcript_24439/g.21694  ORF Transcript_24439/g.21694 Transcript_24439/m.21694 type:complete len:259 (+) Transcript_24439:546-1322(+)
MFEKLQKKYEILVHSKDSNEKKFINLKSNYEKKVKSLHISIQNLENELTEKDKENRLHAMKVKDMMRKFNSESGVTKTAVKEAKQLNRMMSRGSKNRRIKIRDTNISLGSNNSKINISKESTLNTRVRSIEPINSTMKMRRINNPEISIQNNYSTNKIPRTEIEETKGCRKKRVINKRRIHTISRTEADGNTTESDIMDKKTVVNKAQNEINLSSEDSQEKPQVIEFEQEDNVAKEVSPEYLENIKMWICYDYEDFEL